MHIATATPLLSAEQATARDQILDFLDGSEQVLTLGGLAGTGKTTLLASVAAVVPEALVCAPTGKAAHVLRQKTHRTDACTIHSLFYKLIDKDTDPRTGRRLLRFARIHIPGALTGETVLIDEASMVDRWMMRDLIASGARIVPFGDPGQLPPVHGAQYFTRPDITLRTIHRQALDSAIIRQAHEARKTGWYEADGEDFQVARRPTNDDYLVSNAIITWKRPTRQSVNEIKRQLLGFHRPYPQTGETVLCLQNAPMFGVFNGGTYTTLAPFNDKTGCMVLDVDGHEIIIPNCAFTPKDDPIDDDTLTTTFSFGYALTAHKAQGSEYPAVCVIDECPSFRPERKQWIYTALTRASDCVLVVQKP